MLKRALKEYKYVCVTKALMGLDNNYISDIQFCYHRNGFVHISVIFLKMKLSVKWYVTEIPKTGN